MEIVTWNMEGSNASTETKWQTGVNNLLNSAEVVCLQECGGVPPSAKVQANFGNIKFIGMKPDAKGNIYNFAVSYYQWGTVRSATHILFLKTDSKNNKVNMAIVSKTPPDKFLNAKPGLLGARPALGMRIGIWDIFSIHAWSPGGNDAKNLLTNVKDLVNSPWAVLGDYNRVPDKLKVPNGTGKYVPLAVTRRKSALRLDYMVGAGVSKAKIEVLNMELSDHNAVRIEVQ